MGSNAIDGIKGISKGISDTVYNLGTGKVKKVRLDEILSGHGSVPTAHINNNNGPTLFGFGFRSTDTAGTNI